MYLCMYRVNFGTAKLDMLTVLIRVGSDADLCLSESLKISRQKTSVLRGGDGDASLY